MKLLRHILAITMIAGTATSGAVATARSLARSFAVSTSKYGTYENILFGGLSTYLAGVALQKLSGYKIKKLNNQSPFTREGKTEVAQSKARWEKTYFAARKLQRGSLIGIAGLGVLKAASPLLKYLFMRPFNNQLTRPERIKPVAMLALLSGTIGFIVRERNS